MWASDIKSRSVLLLIIADGMKNKAVIESPQIKVKRLNKNEVPFGISKLSSKIRGYTFENSGVSYTCTVNSDSVLDIFYILDTYDSETHIEPIYWP